MMLAFYLGIGFAVVVVVINSARFKQSVVADQAYTFSSAVMLCAAVIGTRIVFALPLELPSNWIFLITEVHGVHRYLTAIRRPLFVLGILLPWTACAITFFIIWPWRAAAAHVGILGLWGLFLAYLCLGGYRKIPSPVPTCRGNRNSTWPSWLEWRC
jgi:hypothetical protein